MPHPCVVCGRSRMNPNNREEEYMFFGFPVNYDTRCREWLEFCCREDLYKLTKKQLLQRMVCSKHFERKDFLNDYFDRLNCRAVPTIYDPKQSLYNITCVLCGRYRKDPPEPDYDGTTFHHFPGEEFRCLKWLDFVGVDSYYRLTRKEILYCYICSCHFDRSQFMPGYRNRLIDNAIPNIRNPDELSDDEKYALEIELDRKFFHQPDKPKKLDPLPPAVLESQACAACGRSRADPRNKVEKYKFHPFPAYEIGRCLRWCQFLGREDLLKMSPNQIRKLVLCSKHFLAGQSFQKVGPCDAVPTIKEVEQGKNLPEVIITEPMPPVFDDVDLCPASLPQKLGKNKEVRPLVSSKKPFVINKPAPLAKKRGKQKRPTSINIPKPSQLNDNRILRKLPLPPASNNWKLQFPNQFQPITIANNITPITNISTDAKKVILPFAGNISSLGQPIPVSSLSSIPPGLLIKIDLPQQEKKVARRGRPAKKQEGGFDEQVGREERKNRGRVRNRISENVQVFQKAAVDEEIHDFVGDRDDHEDFAELLKLSEKIDVHKHEILNDECVIETIREEHEDIEALDEEIEEIEDSMEEFIEELEYGERKECIEMISEEVEATLMNEEHQDDHVDVQETVNDNVDDSFNGNFDGDVKGCAVSGRRRKRRVKRMSARSRRTLIPIRSEVGGFLKKLKPLMHRLPKKARAQLKLSIVTMVIDRL
ncbi:uncharacterized protein LOC107047621 [Diachasma alloeum]|uniref:uncharacterized protein LOC107047621 n=1 Tax=Diachasma alloeum TaxID=454923 RepID=UPI00073822CE|nr:uncharacterized protein LOC107047621 [Diachasma alloeum]